MLKPDFESYKQRGPATLASQPQALLTAARRPAAQRKHNLNTLVDYEKGKEETISLQMGSTGKTSS